MKINAETQQMSRRTCKIASESWYSFQFNTHFSQLEAYIFLHFLSGGKFSLGRALYSASSKSRHSRPHNERVLTDVSFLSVDVVVPPRDEARLKPFNKVDYSLWRTRIKLVIVLAYTLYPWPTCNINIVAATFSSLFAASYLRLAGVGSTYTRLQIPRRRSSDRTSTSRALDDATKTLSECTYTFAPIDTCTPHSPRRLRHAE